MCLLAKLTDVIILHRPLHHCLHLQKKVQRGKPLADTIEACLYKAHTKKKPVAKVVEKTVFPAERAASLGMACFKRRRQ